VRRVCCPPILVLLLRADRSAPLQGSEHVGLDDRVQGQVRVVWQTVGAAGRRDQFDSGKDNGRTADHRSWHLRFWGREGRVDVWTGPSDKHKLSSAALVPGAMGRKGFETRAATTTYLGGDNLKRFSCEFIHEELDGAPTIG
ncbi:hypothetical protein THAOC_30142, partial [Thalassiosira oceanica]